MSARRWAAYLLALAFATIALALISPSTLTMGLALIVAGGGAVFLLARSILSVSISLGTEARPASAVPGAAKEQAEGEPPEGRSDVSAEPGPPQAEGLSRPPGWLPRDRLRVLLLTPRPLDGIQGEGPARVSWRRLSDALQEQEPRPDLQLKAVWPPTMASLESTLREEPCHVAIIECGLQKGNLLLEDATGLAVEARPRELTPALAAGKARLLVLRSTAGDDSPADVLVRNGMESVISAPPSLPAPSWVQFLASLLSSLAQGDVLARSFAGAISALDALDVGSRERPVLLGANWYSLVDRATDGKGLVIGSPPCTDAVRWQPWFRDQARGLSSLLAQLHQGTRAVGVHGAPGSGVTSAGLEACHRLARQVDRVLHADCAVLAEPSLESLLRLLAARLPCRVLEPTLLEQEVLQALRGRPSLILVDHADLLAPPERSRLLSLQDGLAAGSHLILLTSEPWEELQARVEIGGMEPAGVHAWVQWLIERDELAVLKSVSDDSIRALSDGLSGNPLAIAIVLGLIGQLGLLQSIRSAREAASPEAMVDLALQRCGRRELEAATALAILPGPLPAEMVTSILGRSAGASLASLTRLGLTSECQYSDDYALHPYVKDRVRQQFPADAALTTRAAEALAAKARALGARLRSQSEEERETRGEVEKDIRTLLESFRTVLGWAEDDTSPLYGRQDIVRDITFAIVPVLAADGLVFEAFHWSLIGEEAAHRLEDHGTRGRLLLDAADSLAETGERERAAGCCEEAARACQLAKDYRGLADALIRLATMWCEAGEPAAARDPLEQALPVLERLHDTTAQANALAVLGDIARHDDEEAAIRHYNKALLLLEGQANSQPQAGRIHYALGSIHSQSGRHSEAAQEFSRALESFVKAGDTEGRLQAYRALGQTYLRLDDRERAIQVLERAAQLEERQSLGIEAALELGRAYMRNRRWQEALEHQERALAWAEATGERRSIAQAYNSLASVQLEIGDRQRAIEAYKKAAAIWRDLGDDIGLARTYNNLAVAHRRAGRWSEAHRLLSEAAHLLEKRGDKDTLARIYNNMGLILAAQRRQREAAKFYERSLALKAELGDLYGANITRLNLRELSQRP